MLFIHKKSGEVCELMVKSIENPIWTEDGQQIFPIGEFVMTGNVENSINECLEFNEMFEFLGVL